MAMTGAERTRLIGSTGAAWVQQLTIEISEDDPAGDRQGGL
jgi:hypothetical protein